MQMNIETIAFLSATILIAAFICYSFGYREGFNQKTGVPKMENPPKPPSFGTIKFGNVRVKTNSGKGLTAGPPPSIKKGEGYQPVTEIESPPPTGSNNNHFR